MSKMDKKELMALLKDPEVLKELKETSTSDELDGLLEDIDITDEDTMESISKKYQQKLNKVVDYFSKKVESAKTEAIETATQPARDKEAQAIRDFEAKNPGMSNPEIVALMQPLYDKGKTLEQCYAMACRAMEVDPTTGKAPDEKAKEKAEEKPAEKKAPINSMRTKLSDDAEGDESSVEKKKPLSIDEALAANLNEFVAKHGDPFDKRT